jgi:hypothetical protein
MAPSVSDPVHPAVSQAPQAMGETEISRQLGRALINARRPVKGVERTCPKAAPMSPFDLSGHDLGDVRLRGQTDALLCGAALVIGRTC